jgi:hypothetical protein
MADEHNGWTSREVTDTSVESLKENRQPAIVVCNLHHSISVRDTALAPCMAIYLPHRINISNTLPAAGDEAVAEPSQSTIRT